ncbi:tRNA(Ile)-lysidine synthase [Dissulfurispira thermophila]|uniref:tRNA(Ile)-lysidine synthase n=2 Tax=root TaxID=1 RepID=A0A7G1H0D1_9BACT|nr:tRNA lysidine(34) synthetase TilS [Dissulfurispira thermophila]BCB96164.1 tRNA(Ile)-lysidine synthase [Dissulfurispira thermophila]
MEIIKKVRETINKYHMLAQGDHVLVGLSGGPDSVCLLTILHRLSTEFGINLSAVYINHGLRSDEIPYEIELCEDLCSSMDIPFITKSIDVRSYIKEKKLNKQEAARELRYNAFNEIAIQRSANKIAVGHNADDQAETIIMRLFRGTGPSGLAGIPPIRSQRSGISNQKIDLIRPLIEIERYEIEDFLETEGIGFAIDSSNLKQKYFRNKIRQLIVPIAKKINMDVIKTISRTADIFRDEERYFEIIVTKNLMKLITRKNDNTIELFIGPLEAMDTVILRRVLRRAIDETRGLRGISFTHIEEIISLIKSGKSGDRIYLPENIRAIKGYSTLILTSERPVRLGTYTIDGVGEIVLRESQIVIRSTIMGINEVKDYGDSQKNAVIDADKVHFPMIIRGRLHGDFFYPLGFGKKKKLQDYFVDEKIPRDERDAIALLISDNNIVWVIGYRLDERYKVDKDTKRVLKFEVKPLRI